MDYEEFYYFMIHGRIGEQHVGGKGAAVHLRKMPTLTLMVTSILKLL